MNRNAVFVFLVLVFAAAILAALTLLPAEDPSAVEMYPDTLELEAAFGVAVRDCRAVEIAEAGEDYILYSRQVADYVRHLADRAGLDPRSLGSFQTRSCWGATHFPIEGTWLLIYETEAGEIRIVQILPPASG